MNIRLGWLAFAAVVAGPVLASPTDDAVALVKERQFEAARTALRGIVASEPENARALSYLSLAAMRSGETTALDEAVASVEKASKLAPNDAEILANSGQVWMEVASRRKSLSAATKGREALERALKANPDDGRAREILYHYFAHAPWPLGSKSKAAAHLEEIRLRDPGRAATLSVNGLLQAKKFEEVFKICEEQLAKNPEDALALFNYGRAAASSGLHMEQGMERLRGYIALAPTFQGAPSVGNAWGRIGIIHEKKGQPEEARAAYRKVLELEPNNKVAAAALAAVK